MSGNDFRHLFPSSKGATVQAGEKELQAVQRLQELKSLGKQLEEEEEQLKAILMAALGDCDALTHEGKTLATWRSSKPVAGFDMTAFRAVHPDIHAKFSTEGAPRRPLLIK